MWALLTGESLLVVLPHGDEIPQTGIVLFHDALQEMERCVKGVVDNDFTFLTLVSV